MIDYFFHEIAMNDLTGQPVPDAEADVYAMTDTGFTTPLPITDIQGLPLAKLKASPTGIFPAFRCPGQTQVVAKSGDLTTPISSRFGFVFEVVPDPTGSPDDYVLATSSGGYVLVPLPGSGGEATGVRESVDYVTATLAAGAREFGTVAMGWTYELIRIEVDGPARVRLYDTTAHRDADAARERGTDPDPDTDHGVMLDFALEDADARTLSPVVTGVTLTGVNVPITVDNLDAGSSSVSVTLTYLRTE